MNSAPNFRDLQQQLNRSSTRAATGARIIGSAFLESLFSPQERCWFLACRAWACGGPGPETAPELYEILESLDIEARTMVAVHLNCARILRDVPPADRFGQLRQIATTAQVSVGLLADLAREMGGATDPFSNGSYVVGEQRSVCRAVHITALLVERLANGDLRGVPADLCLELIAEGTETLYPSPELAFVSRDDHFRGAEFAAVEFLKTKGWWPAGCDVRWRLVRRDGKPMALGLAGASLGGCFGVALLKLVAGDFAELSHLASMSLGEATIAAALDESGQLLPTEATVPKFLAAEVHTILVSHQQSVEWLGFEPDVLQERVLVDPQRDLHIIQARDLLEALVLLQTDRATRWPGIDCALPPRNPDFVGRADLFERVDEFLRHQVSGYLLIEGAMGRGKTSFITELVHRRIAAGLPPIYHFISSYTAPGSHPERILACFYDRLRHKHRIPEHHSWTSLPIEEKLQRVLFEVSRRLEETGGQEVLILEAADQAELPLRQTLIPGFLAKLPPRVLCIISARPIAEHMIFGEDVTIWDLDACVRDRDDIRVYLQRQNATLEPPLPEAFVEQIVTQDPPPVFFTVATCMRELRDPTTPKERNEILRRACSEWNRSPEELVRLEIGRRLQQAQAAGIADADFWLILGLLAVAREPLSLDMLGGLGLLADPQCERVLALCSAFFEPRLTLHDPHLPYKFAHPGYIRAIISLVGTWRVSEAHRRLAQGCQNAWRDPENPACQYALQHWLSHLRRGRQHDALAETLTDFAYLERSLALPPGPSGGQPKCADHLARPALSIFDLISYFQRSWQDLRSVNHPLAPQVQALEQVIEQHSHLLQQDPSLLAQIACNELSAAWGPATRLGAQIRQAVRQYQRPWLRLLRMTRPGEAAAVVKRWPGHQKSVTSLAFRLTGHLLASGSKDSTVRIWDTRTGQCLQILRGHDGPVTSLAVLPDEGGLLSGGADGTVRIWSWKSQPNTNRRLIRAAASNVLAIAVSDDGTKLATGAGDDHTVRVWDLKTGALLHEFKGHRAAIKSLAFSPKGHQIASGAEDSSICIWHLDSQRSLLIPQDTWVHALAFSPDGRVLVSGGGLAQGIVRFWNPETGECLRTVPGHTGGICCLAFSPDGQRLASGGYDRTVLIRDAGAGTVLGQVSHGGTVHAVAFSPDREFVASGGDDRIVRLVQTALNPQEEPSPDRAGSHRDASVLNAVQIAPNGRFAVSGGRLQPDRAWDVATGAPQGSFASRPHDTTTLAISPDSQLIASGSFQEVSVWASEMARLHTTLKGHESWVLAVEFSPSGERIVTGSEDKRIMLWEAASGRWLRTFSGHRDKVRAVSFSGNGRFIVSGAEDSTARIWEVETGRLCQTLEGHNGHIVDVAFLSDHRTIITAGTDESVRFWDTESGKCLKVIKVPAGEISALAVSPDSRFFAVGGVEAMVGVWEIATAQLVASTMCQHEILALSFAAANPGDATEFARRRVLHIADGGGACHIPKFYTMEIVGLI